MSSSLRKWVKAIAWALLMVAGYNAGSLVATSIAKVHKEASENKRTILELRQEIAKLRAEVNTLDEFDSMCENAVNDHAKSINTLYLALRECVYRRVDEFEKCECGPADAANPENSGAVGNLFDGFSIGMVAKMPKDFLD